MSRMKCHFPLTPALSRGERELLAAPILMGEGPGVRKEAGAGYSPQF